MDDDAKGLSEWLDRSLRTAGRTMRRLSYAGLALLAFGLVLIGKVDTRLVDAARGTISDISAPVLDALSYPLVSAYESLRDLSALGDVMAENERLREENAKLARLRLVAHDLQAENQALRRLLRFDPGPVTKSVATRVIADTGGVFARSLMVYVGSAQGVRKDLAVLAAEGLVGRVQTVGERASRILLITDLNSKIPVAIGVERRRAIMAGTNGQVPRLEYFASNVQPTEGALVLTSGDGGVFRAGLPIGIVARGANGGWQVSPFVDWNRLDFVRIVDFGAAPTLDLAGEAR